MSEWLIGIPIHCFVILGTDNMFSALSVNELCVELSLLLRCHPDTFYAAARWLAQSILLWGNSTHYFVFYLSNKRYWTSVQCHRLAWADLVFCYFYNFNKRGVGGVGGVKRLRYYFLILWWVSCPFLSLLSTLLLFLVPFILFTFLKNKGG